MREAHQPLVKLDQRGLSVPQESLYSLGGGPDHATMHAALFLAVVVEDCVLLAAAVVVPLVDGCYRAAVEVLLTLIPSLQSTVGR